MSAKREMVEFQVWDSPDGRIRGSCCRTRHLVPRPNDWEHLQRLCSRDAVLCHFDDGKAPQFDSEFTWCKRAGKYTGNL